MSTVELAHEEHGDPDAPPMLLLTGLGAQRAWWPPALVARFAEEHRVVVPDNRDVGRSPWFTDLRPPGELLAELGAGRPVEPPYTLATMAADAVALLDRLGLADAHVVGVSMGGMIAQHLAFGFPERVRSLTSIMSTTGDPSLPPGRPEVLASLFAEVPTDDLEAFLDASVAGSRLSAGPHFDEADARRRYRAYWETGLYADGGTRHALAVLTDGDRTERLAAVAAPTLVVHGTVDGMLPVECGRATAEAIPGARLLELADVGHELPSAVHDRVAAAVLEHAAAADGRAAGPVHGADRSA